MKIKKFLPVILAFIFILLLSLAMGGAAKSEKGYNVIIIVFDALRADHLGCYGYEKNISPNIDAFCLESHVFTDSIAQCGTTYCSLASFFTSKYPFTDAVLEDGLKIKDSELTIGEILVEDGYKAGFITKGSMRDENKSLAAIEILDDWDRNDEPFFMYIHFRRPHSPYTPSDEVFNRLYPHNLSQPVVHHAGFKGYSSILQYYSEVMNESMHEYVIFGMKLNMTPTMIAQFTALYDGNIVEADNYYGLLMDFLDESNMSDNTVVILISDHGESLGENYVFDHNTLDYGVLHTPLIVRVPGGKPDVRDYPVSNIDLLPTILYLAGVEYDGFMRGKNLFVEDRKDYYQFSEYKDYKVLKKADLKLGYHPKSRSFRVSNVTVTPESRVYLSNENSREYNRLEQEMMAITYSRVNYSGAGTLERLREIGYAY